MRGEGSVFLYQKGKRFYCPAVHSDAPLSNGWGYRTYSTARAFSMGIFCGNLLEPLKAGCRVKSKKSMISEREGVFEVTDSCTVKDLGRPDSPSARFEVFPNTPFPASCLRVNRWKVLPVKHIFIGFLVLFSKSLTKVFRQISA